MKHEIAKLTAKVDLHTRVLYKISMDLGDIKREITRYSRPTSMDAESANPQMNQALTGLVPIDTRDQEVKLFTKAKGETDADVRNRLIWLRRFILTDNSWDASFFVSRMIRKICTPKFRRAYFSRGSKS